MKTKVLALFIFSSLLFLNSCSKDEEPGTAVTYLNQIKPLLTTSCTPCHIGEGVNPHKFDNYATAKSKISVIIDRVQREPSAAGFMPLGGTKLSAENIALLQKWMADGLLEK